MSVAGSDARRFQRPQPAAAAPAGTPAQRLRAARRLPLAVRVAGFCSRFNADLMLSLFVDLPLAVLQGVVAWAQYLAPCDQPLIAFHIVNAVLVIARVTYGVYLHFAEPANLAEYPARVRAQYLGRLYRFYNLLRIAVIVWLVVGMVWTFRARECQLSSPHVYRTALATIVLFFVHVLVVVIAFLIVWRGMVQSQQYGGIALGRALLLSLLDYRPPMRPLPPQRLEDFSAVSFTDAVTQSLIPSEDSKCAICLNDYESEEQLYLLPCRHHFHQACVREWFARNSTCPMCRSDLSDDAPVAPAPPPRPGAIDAGSVNATPPPPPADERVIDVPAAEAPAASGSDGASGSANVQFVDALARAWRRAQSVADSVQTDAPAPS